MFQKKACRFQGRLYARVIPDSAVIQGDVQVKPKKDLLPPNFDISYAQKAAHRMARHHRSRRK
jgi:hypothetical protein